MELLPRCAEDDGPGTKNQSVGVDLQSSLGVVEGLSGVGDLLTAGMPELVDFANAVLT